MSKQWPPPVAKSPTKYHTQLYYRQSQSALQAYCGKMPANSTGPPLVLFALDTQPCSHHQILVLQTRPSRA